MLVYYLYRHIREDKNIPFYIGIGSYKSEIIWYSERYKRALDKVRRNKIWHRVVAISKIDIQIMYETNSKDEIIAKEKEFISLYKRINDGGVLCNISLGGEGAFGVIHSDDFREKCSQRAKIINPNLGKKLSVNHRQKISASNKGKKMSAMAVEKMKSSQIFPIVCVETNKIFLNAADCALKMFGSIKRHTRCNITKSIRENKTFKNYTFNKWVA